MSGMNTEKTFSCLLFDLDGTLINTTEGVLKCVIHALKKMGRSVPPPDERKRYMGPPLTESFEQFAGMTPEEARAAEFHYRNRYRRYGKKEIEEYPGVRALLEKLKQAGCPMAVATSKLERTAVEVLRSVGYLPFFQTVSGSDPTGTVSSKPDVIRQAMERMGLRDPEGVWMIGDRKYDVFGAKTLSLISVGFDTGNAEDGELENAGADFVARSASELEAILLPRFRPRG